MRKSGANDRNDGAGSRGCGVKKRESPPRRNRGGGRGGGFPCVSASMEERYTEASIIPGRYYLSPFGMFEVLARASGGNIGKRGIELRAESESDPYR